METMNAETFRGLSTEEQALHILDCLRSLSSVQDHIVLEGYRGGVDWMIPLSKYSNDGYYGKCQDKEQAEKCLVRLVDKNNGRIVARKIGKVLRESITENNLYPFLTEGELGVMIEYLSKKWYFDAAPEKYHLVIDRNFYEAYNDDQQCEEDDPFISCMSNSDHYLFYEMLPRDSVKSARLYDGERLLARANLYECRNENTRKTVRILDRQYAYDQLYRYKKALVDACYNKGLIDYNKPIDAGCGDAELFSDRYGNVDSMHLSYYCFLEGEITSAYQDTFKYYCRDDNRFYNYCWRSMNFIDFNNTHETAQISRYYDEYNEEWTDDELVTVYADGEAYQTSEERLDDFVYLEYLDQYHHYEDIVHSEYNGQDYLASDAVYVESIDDYIHSDSDDIVFTYFDEWILTKDSIFSKIDNHYYKQDDERVKYLPFYDDYTYIFADETVTDHNGDNRLKKDCVYSKYHGYYIPIDETLIYYHWVENVSDYLRDCPEIEADENGGYYLDENSLLYAAVKSNDGISVFA